MRSNDNDIDWIRVSVILDRFKIGYIGYETMKWLPMHVVVHPLGTSIL